MTCDDAMARAASEGRGPRCDHRLAEYCSCGEETLCRHCWDHAACVVCEQLTCDLCTYRVCAACGMWKDGDRCDRCAAITRTDICCTGHGPAYAYDLTAEWIKEMPWEKRSYAKPVASGPIMTDADCPF